MTLPENRKPEGLEKNQVKVIDGEVLIERVSARRIHLIHGGKRLVLRSKDLIHAHWEDEE